MQEQKRATRVAVIDEGIHENMDFVFKKINRCYVEKGRLYQGTAEQILPLSHGTICAAVIASKETDIELFDIRIFKDGNAEMEDLIIALQYCISCGAQVINLSCGTLNYLDYKKVEPTLYKLRRKNVMIVSAFSNQGIMSFPASCGGVFGVRADFGKRLKGGEYGFQGFTGGRLENSIVAHIGTVAIGDSKLKVMANSYAAPVITGEIAGILRNHPGYSFRQVLKCLILRGVKEGYQGRDPKKYLSDQGKEVNTPILGIDCRCRCLKDYLKGRLQADSYYVTTVSEYVQDKTEIPCRYYMSRKNPLDKDVIYTVEQIYDPDIIIFFLDTRRFHIDAVLNMVDIYIFQTYKGIKLESIEDQFISGDCAKIYEYVLSYFKEQEC